MKLNCQKYSGGKGGSLEMMNHIYINSDINIKEKENINIGRIFLINNIKTIWARSFYDLLYKVSANAKHFCFLHHPWPVVDLSVLLSTK